MGGRGHPDSAGQIIARLKVARMVAVAGLVAAVLVWQRFYLLLGIFVVGVVMFAVGAWLIDHLTEEQLERLYVLADEPGALSGSTELTAVDPSGRRYFLEVRARGVTSRFPLGAGALVWLLSWIWHGVRYRGQWIVEVRARNARRGQGLRKRLAPDVWIYEPYRSKEEAITAMQILADQITNGLAPPPQT